MRRSFRLSTLSCVLGISAALMAQTSLQRPDGSAISSTQIDRTVNQLMQSAHVTGVGLALFHGGKIVYLKAYGMRDTEKGLPLTPDSEMTAASLTKAAFATMVMRLVEERKLDLDKPIDEYLPKPLPEYPRYADLKGDNRYKKLTLRILLSHRSGFANFRAFESDRKLRIHFEPGSRYAYSGEGIELAQFVVETAMGQPLEELMQKNLFGPVGMTRTSMVWQPRFESDFANGYDEYGRSLGPERRPKADAAGSMQTTLRDYADFLSALMRGKVLDRRAEGVMLATQVMIHSAHQFPSLAEATSAADDAIRLRYGIGWGMYSSPYGKAFFKEGHDEGWRHLALLFRQPGDGVLIMTNSSNGEGIFKPLLDEIVGPTGFPFEWESYTPYNLLPPLPKLKEHKRVELEQAQMDRLAGKYRLDQNVVITVTTKDGRLFVQENDETPQELAPESAEDFYSTSSSDEWSFRLSGDGPAQVLVLHLEDKDVEFKRVQ